MKALYAYEAQGADELSLQEGVTYELTPDGENYGDGWWEGVDSRGRKVSSVIGYDDYTLTHSMALWYRAFSQAITYVYISLSWSIHS